MCDWGRLLESVWTARVNDPSQFLRVREGVALDVLLDSFACGGLSDDALVAAYAMSEDGSASEAVLAAEIEARGLGPVSDRDPAARRSYGWGGVALAWVLTISGMAVLA